MRLRARRPCGELPFFLDLSFFSFNCLLLVIFELSHNLVAVQQKLICFLLQRSHDKKFGTSGEERDE
jgi:hypothetical protein